MEINLEKKHFAIIAAFCLILATGLVAANQETILRFANPSIDILPGKTVGHSSADLVVNIPGCLATDDISLQDAIDNDCLGSGGSLGQPAWDSDWIAFTAGTADTLIFPEITGATVDDLFVDLQVKTDAVIYTVPVGISNLATSYDTTSGWGLYYGGLTNSSITVYQGGNPGGAYSHYRVRIWNTI